MIMTNEDGAMPLLQALASFRYALRQFLQFSEEAAQGVGLQPQQHQLLLQVAGAPNESQPTIAYAAERLGLKHNSVVELVDRCAGEGLLERQVDPRDRRRVVLRITPRGSALLRRLAKHHARELHEMRPRLLAALEQIVQPAPGFQAAQAARAASAGDTR